MRGLLTARELSRERIERLAGSARDYRAGGGRRHPGAVVALMFLEDSLRTRVGFDVAAARLDARTTTVGAERRSPAMWGKETLEDMVRVVAPWCDAVCLRDAGADAPSRAAAVTPVPVINCGNGEDEHPAQALVDAFALLELFGRIDGLRVALVGDLERMRTAHSLALLLARFDEVHVRCIGPAGLTLPDQYAQPLRDAGHALETTTEMEVDGFDVLYVAGLPAETSAGVLSPEEQARFHATPAVVARLADGGRILCPLPRVDEIPATVDPLAQAAYFDQSALGLWMRVAVLDEVLGGG